MVFYYLGILQLFTKSPNGGYLGCWQPFKKYNLWHAPRCITQIWPQRITDNMKKKKSLRAENQGLQRMWAKEILQGSRTRCCHMNEGVISATRPGILLLLPSTIWSLLFQVGTFYSNYALLYIILEGGAFNFSSSSWDPRPQHAISRSVERSEMTPKPWTFS